MALTTTPNGVWVLQELLGVETLPVALRLRPFIPSLYDDSVVVATTAGPVPVAQTAEHASLVAAGVIDEVVIDAVGESEHPDQQVELICNAMLPAFGDADPADIEGVNVPAELMYTTLNNAAPHGHDVLVLALARLGLAPP